MTATLTAAAPLELQRDISSTVEEFVRALRRAFPDLHEKHPGAYLARLGEVTLAIDFTVGPIRRIALLALPTLLVSLRFAGGDRALQTAMLEHLDRYLHRGGG